MLWSAIHVSSGSAMLWIFSRFTEKPDLMTIVHGKVGPLSVILGIILIFAAHNDEKNVIHLSGEYKMPFF